MSADYNPNSIDAALARTETKLSDLSNDIKELRCDIHSMIERHEERITILERFRWQLAGFAAAAGGVTGFIATIFN